TSPAAPDTAPLPLHDALPISARGDQGPGRRPPEGRWRAALRGLGRLGARRGDPPPGDPVPPPEQRSRDLLRLRRRVRRVPRRLRSEEHTSELQSLTNLVCRLL